jgi:hypothetical protein
VFACALIVCSVCHCKETRSHSPLVLFFNPARLERFSLLRQSDIAPRAKRGCFLKSFVYATMVSTAKVNIAAGNTQYTGALLMHTAGSLFII